MTPRDAALSSPRARVGYTPSFDGVFNSGESWVARRRASEASLKSGVGSSREHGDQLDNKTSEIREEEENSGRQPQNDGQVEDTVNVNQPDPSSFSALPQSSHNESNLLESQIAAVDLSTGVSGLNVPEPLNSHPSNGPAPSISDLASVEWSYKDPSGQVQGNILISVGKLPLDIPHM